MSLLSWLAQRLSGTRWCELCGTAKATMRSADDVWACESCVQTMLVAINTNRETRRAMRRAGVVKRR